MINGMMRHNTITIKNKMKKLLFFILLSTFAFGQKISLTPNGFTDADDHQKNYVVLEFPGKTKSEIYTATNLFLNKQFNNPSKVISVVDNEQIVVNAIDNKAILSSLDYYYNDAYTFKDGKIKYEPTIKHLEYVGGSRNTIVPLKGFNGIYSSDGEVNNKIKPAVEDYMNARIAQIKSAILQQLNDDF